MFVIAKPPLDLYTPGASVMPPSSPLADTSAGRPFASTIAVARLPIHAAAALSVRCLVPITSPGGNPVIAVPGDRARSPFTMEYPELVTVAPATIAYGVQEPMLILAGAAKASAESNFKERRGMVRKNCPAHKNDSFYREMRYITTMPQRLEDKKDKA